MERFLVFGKLKCITNYWNNMLDGWIKLHRALVNWEWYTTPNMVHFWIHCLLLANHDDGFWKGIPVKKGQFISGRKSLSANTGLSEQQIRSCINRLILTNEITIQSTNEYSVFTLISWEKYQLEEAVNQPSNQRSTSDQPAINQRSTTNKNDKNDKNEKKNTKERIFFVPPNIQDCIGFFFTKNADESEAMQFFNYYESNGWIVGRTKMKSWQSAASLWISRGNKWKSQFTPQTKQQIKNDSYLTTSDLTMELIDEQFK
jgi:hypothetical protein